MPLIGINHYFRLNVKHNDLFLADKDLFFGFKSCSWVAIIQASWNGRYPRPLPSEVEKTSSASNINAVARSCAWTRHPNANVSWFSGTTAFSSSAHGFSNISASRF